MARIFIAVFLLVTFRLTLAFDWHYGEDGEKHWTGMCRTGQRQSPINLSLSKSLRTKLEPRIYKGFERPFSAKITNNGHTLTIQPNHTNQITMFKGGLPDNVLYSLENVHFHWGGSEHTIGGIQYAAECHIVFKNSLYRNKTRAFRDPYGLAVLAVLFHLDEQNNAALEPILRLAQNLTVPYSTATLDKFRAFQFLPNNMFDLYLYRGSLTTPECHESVTWTVFTSSLPISENQINRLQKLQFPDGNSIISNGRSVQPQNGRLVLHQEKSFSLNEALSVTASHFIAVSVCFGVLLTQSFMCS